MNDPQNSQEWGNEMDAPSHVSTYQLFVRGSIALMAAIALVLILMAAFLT